MRVRVAALAAVGAAASCRSTHGHLESQTGATFDAIAARPGEDVAIVPRRRRLRSRGDFVGATSIYVTRFRVSRAGRYWVLAQPVGRTSPGVSLLRHSVADSLAAHKPFVLVFATAKFCESPTCGPVVDVTLRTVT